MTEFIRATRPATRPAQFVTPGLPTDSRVRHTCAGCGRFCFTPEEIEAHQCDPDAVADWEDSVRRMSTGKGGWKPLNPFQPRHPVAPVPPGILSAPPAPEPPAPRAPAAIPAPGTPFTRQRPRRPPRIRDLDPTTLPGVNFLTHLSDLPARCAVYFALTAEGEVLYIGASKNLKQRWTNLHERAYDLRDRQCARLTWYETTEEEMHALERVLIRKFAPPVNQRSALKDSLLTLWVPQTLYEDVLAYSEEHSLTLQELVCAGLRLALTTEPEALLRFTSRTR